MNTSTFQLAEVADQIRGVTYSKEDAIQEPRPGYLPILRANNITDSGITWDDLVYVPEDLVSLKQRLRNNDILVATSSGSLSVVGKAARIQVDRPAGFGAFCKVIRPLAGVDPGYIFHYFKTGEYRALISRLAAGANINNLRNEHLDGLSIPKRDIADQRRLAALLDQADALRRKRQESLRLAEEFRRSVFYQMFGNPSRNKRKLKVGVVGDLLESTQYGTSGKAEADSGEYAVLRMNNITYQGGWNFDSLKYMDLSEIELNKYSVRKGQILFNRTNSRELVGKCAVFREDKPMVFAGYLVRGIPKANADAEYIAAHLNSKWGKERLLAMCKAIVGMANINAEEFKSIPILMAPESDQKMFGNIVRESLARETSLTQSLAMSDDLFRSLQNRAFAGEL